MKKIADDSGIGVVLIYNWWREYRSEGEKSGEMTLKEKVKKLRLENVELRIEQDM